MKKSIKKEIEIGRNSLGIGKEHVREYTQSIMHPGAIDQALSRGQRPRAQRREPMAHEWVWAAKVAARAQAVLSAWEGPGAADGDAEALETLREFAKQVERQDGLVVDLACDMLLGKSMKAHELASEGGYGMVNEAVADIDDDAAKQRVRSALGVEPREIVGP